MKVYYINSGYDGCHYVRCLLPMIYNGWWGAKTSLRSPKESTDRMLEGALSADVVVFQRPMQDEMLEAAKLLKQKGKKIVMDNDDTYKSNSGLPKVMANMLERQIDKQISVIDKRLHDFARISDLVTVTTEFLAEEYRPYSSNVIVLPNMVDPADWPKPKRSGSSKVRIGLVGSTTMNDDPKQIVPILRSLGKRDDVQLVMFGIPPVTEANKDILKFFGHEIAFWNTMNIEWQHAVNMADYFQTLNNLELDIMLIPRADNYFNRCKSNVKFLEASMLEIPVIAQGFADGKSPYQVDKEDADHLLIVNTEEDWYIAIDKLVASKSLRRSIGSKAKKYVTRKYNIKKTAHLWAKAYESMFK